MKFVMRKGRWMKISTCSLRKWQETFVSLQQFLVRMMMLRWIKCFLYVFLYVLPCTFNSTNCLMYFLIIWVLVFLSLYKLLLLAYLFFAMHLYPSFLFWQRGGKYIIERSRIYSLFKLGGVSLLQILIYCFLFTTTFLERRVIIIKKGENSEPYFEGDILLIMTSTFHDDN